MNLKEISDFELFAYKNIVTYLSQLSNSTVTSKNEKEIFDLLEQLFIYIPYGKDEFRFPEIYRLSINKNIIKANERINDIRYLKYPSDKKLIQKFGRCNLREQNILYASLSSMTSFDEMKPRTGDLITESLWQLKSSKPLIYVPLFSNQPTNGPLIFEGTNEVIHLTNIKTYRRNLIFEQEIEIYPKNLKELSKITLQFIADIFSKMVNPNNHFDYIFSAFLSNKFLYEIEDGKIDAILYASVQDKLNSENLAIKPNVFDELYELSEIHECLVTHDPYGGNSGYRMESVNYCSSFDYATSKILWENKTNFPKKFHGANERNKKGIL